MERIRSGGRTRRSFLVSAGAVTIGAATIPLGSLLAPGAAAQEDEGLSDGAIAGFVESMELAVAEAYRAAGASGLLSAAVAQATSAFATHHTEHAAAVARIGGSDALGRANAKLVATVADQMLNARDERAVLQILLDLENAASGTYLFAIGEFDSDGARAAAASILPVESQHAVVIGEAMGDTLAELVPDYENQNRALDPARFPTTTTTTSTTTAG